MKKIVVVLSGCGVYDGAEIQESVCTLLQLDRLGAKITCAAPDIAQYHTVNHLTGKEMEHGSRNVLTEAARISRGEIVKLSDIKMANFDGLIFPGGFGAAKNLCTLAFDGPNCSINDDVRRVILEVLKEMKPVGFICIAPAMGAKAVEGRYSLKLTIGNDKGTADAIRALGSTHIDCPVDDIVVDKDYKVVSTPAYMLGPSIAYVCKGIEKLVDKVVELA